MTEEQKLEEGKRMFSIFAARMFEQRVLQAYREKVAQERQMQLLRELEDEDKLSKEKEAKKQTQNQKKKEKLEQKKAAQAEREKAEGAGKADAAKSDAGATKPDAPKSDAGDNKNDTPGATLYAASPIPDDDQLKSPSESTGARTPKSGRPPRNPWTIFWRSMVGAGEEEVREFFGPARGGVSGVWFNALEQRDCRVGEV